MTYGECAAIYTRLRVRALLAAKDGQERGYINLLWTSWAKEFAKQDPTAEAPVAAERISQVVTEQDLTPSALIEWLDAYPAALLSHDAETVDT